MISDGMAKIGDMSQTSIIEKMSRLEHQIKYKQNVEHAEKVIARLKECVDETRQEIRIEMDNIKEDTTGPQALYEKLKKIEINFI